MLFQKSKLKARTILLPRFSEKRRSSFDLWALKELSKMSPHVGLAVQKAVASRYITYIFVNSWQSCEGTLAEKVPYLMPTIW